MQDLGMQCTSGRWLPILAVALGCGTTAGGPAGAPGPRTGWTPTYAKLNAASDDPNLSVVFRISGTLLATMAGPSSANPEPGAVYLYEQVGGRWERRQRLVAPDGHPDDAFGHAIDIAGSTVVIGAPKQRDRGVGSGLVHVFERGPGGAWSAVAKLSSPDPADRGGFGHHVVIDGESLVVGEDRRSEGWPANRAVYTFARDGAGWRPEATIAAPTDLPAPNVATDASAFGYYFDLDGSSLAIGAAGADTVLLYERGAGGWIRHQTLEHPNGRLRDPKGRSNERGGAFGRTLDLDGDVLVVGALRADGDVPDAGAAYVYRRVQGAWHLEARLIGRDGATNDMFGHWVAHDRGLIVSGAFRHSAAGRPGFGAAYLFARRQGDWQLVHKLVVPDEPSRKSSNYIVDLDGGTAVLSGGNLEGTERRSVYLVDVGGAQPGGS